MSFTAEYPNAIVYPAHETNYYTPEGHGGIPNWPRALFLHTPEEPADNYPYTPVFFADPNRQASTHYFVSYTGKVYQCVEERNMAIANGLVGKPLPRWADPNTSLNWQSLSIEIEGYAGSVGVTCQRGGPQWTALVAWIVDRCKAHGIPLDRDHVMGHYEVANNRSDPGTLNLSAVVGDAIMLQATSPQEEDDMITILGQFADNIPWQKSYLVYVDSQGRVLRQLVASAGAYEALLAAGYPTKKLATVEQIATG